MEINTVLRNMYKYNDAAIIGTGRSCRMRETRMGSDPGVCLGGGGVLLELLCDELKRFSLRDIEFYLPQFCNLLLSRPHHDRVIEECACASWW